MAMATTESAHHRPRPIPRIPAIEPVAVIQSAFCMSASANRIRSWSCSASGILARAMSTGPMAV